MARGSNKPLRSGYTTGACAAASAKAAVRCLLGNIDTSVEIPFPDGSRHRFDLCRVQPTTNQGAMATVVKDAGDDPDVTNGAEIGAEVRWLDHSNRQGESDQSGERARSGQGDQSRTACGRGRTGHQSGTAQQ